MLFRNISKTTQYFFLIVSGPHRRVLKTFSESFQIGKIGNFFTQKSPNIFFFEKTNLSPEADHPLGDPQGVPFEYLSILYSEKFLLLRKKVLY